MSKARQPLCLGDFTEAHELDRKVASAEGNDWAMIIAAGSEGVVGEVGKIAFKVSNQIQSAVHLQSH